MLGVEMGSRERSGRSIVRTRMCDFSQAEIENLRVPTFGDKNVRRFDVAMNDSLGVRGIERVGDFDGKIEDAPGFHGPAADHVLDVLAFQAFHGNESLAIFLADVIDRTDIRVIQSGGGLGFAPEPAQGLSILGELPGEEFQGHEAIQARVLRFVNDTHASTAEFFDDAVVRDGPADHWAEILGSESRQVNEDGGLTLDHLPVAGEKVR